MFHHCFPVHRPVFYGSFTGRQLRSHPLDLAPALGAIPGLGKFVELPDENIIIVIAILIVMVSYNNSNILLVIVLLLLVNKHRP